MLIIEDLNIFVKLNNKEFDNSYNTKIPIEKVNVMEVLNFCYLIFYTKQKFDNNKQKVVVKITYEESITNLIIKTNEVSLI